LPWDNINSIMALHIDLLFEIILLIFQSDC
jgi:hypothetical protein